MSHKDLAAARFSNRAVLRKWEHVTVRCVVCDSPIERKAGPGRIPRYCSNACRNKAAYARALKSGRIKPRGPLPPAERSKLAAAAASARWSSVPADLRAQHGADLAAARWGGHAAQPKPTKQPRECRFCGTTVQMTSRQITCGSTPCRLARNAERMREGGWAKLRRARAATSAVEVIAPGKVFERDGWACGICGGEVDKTLKHPDPMSASIDHVVALSNGGTHTWDNVQCAHLTCNVAKGNRERGRRSA